MDVAFGRSNFHTPFMHGSKVTMGDILVTCAQMLLGMFIFELIYRTKISPVSVVHHMGSILVGQAAIVISIKEDRDASIEFVLCTVWGMTSFLSKMVRESSGLTRPRYFPRGFWYYIRVPSTSRHHSLSCLSGLSYVPLSALPYRLHHDLGRHYFWDDCRNVPFWPIMASMVDCVQDCDSVTAHCILGSPIARHKYFLQDVEERASNFKGAGVLRQEPRGWRIGGETWCRRAKYRRRRSGCTQRMIAWVGSSGEGIGPCWTLYLS